MKDILAIEKDMQFFSHLADRLGDIIGTTDDKVAAWKIEPGETFNLAVITKQFVLADLPFQEPDSMMLCTVLQGLQMYYRERSTKCKEELVRLRAGQTVIYT